VTIGGTIIVAFVGAVERIFFNEIRQAAGWAQSERQLGASCGMRPAERAAMNGIAFGR
jgi:hypothetical protein